MLFLKGNRNHLIEKDLISFFLLCSTLQTTYKKLKVEPKKPNLSYTRHEQMQNWLDTLQIKPNTAKPNRKNSNEAAKSFVVTTAQSGY